MRRAKKGIGSEHRKLVASKRKNPMKPNRPRRTLADMELRREQTYARLFHKAVHRYAGGNLAQFLRDLDEPSPTVRSCVAYLWKKAGPYAVNPHPRISQKGQLRHSTQADAIVDAMEALSFPYLTPAVMRELELMDKEIGLSRMKNILKERWNWLVKKARTVSNASRPVQCAQRVEDAIAMQDRVDWLRKIWNKRWDKGDKEFRWFYYDQSPINQLLLDGNSVIAPAGLVVYSPNRTSSRSVTITLHMLMDQWGEVIYFEFAGPKKTPTEAQKLKAKKGKNARQQGTGQGQRDIERFLHHAEKSMPRKQGGHHPWIFFDHLDAHVAIAEGRFACKHGKKLRAHYMLTPLTYPDANAIEDRFRSFKAFLRTKMWKQAKTWSAKKFIPILNQYMREWKRQGQLDSGLFENSYDSLQEIIDAKGDLQVRAAKKMGFEDLSQIQLTTFPMVETMTDEDDEEWTP